MSPSHRTAIVTVLCAALVSVTGTASTDARSPPERAARRSAPMHAVSTRLTFNGASRTIPAGFLGLSVEVSEITRYELAGRAVDHVFGLLRSPGDGRLLLRVGGTSADHAWWYTAGKPAPAGVFTIGRPWVSGLAALVARDDLRVVLGLNLAVHSPALEVAFASAVQRALPRSTLAGLEIGNEPDLYEREQWLQRQRLATTERALPRRWTQAYSPGDYQADYESYAWAVRARLGPISLEAPDTTTPALAWLRAATGLRTLDPEIIAVHSYPLSTCWPKDSAEYPTVARLLAEHATVGLANSVRRAAQFAHEDHMTFRVTELNSVSCGGNTGVADSFATALWAPDALFELLSAGVDGVNVHLHPDSLNAPFQLTADGIRPLPELYGLALFAQLIGSHARLLDTNLHAPRGLHLKAWATRHGSVTAVLLIDKSDRDAEVSIPAAGRGAPPAVLRLLQAPSIRSVGEVVYAGRSIGSDGRWQGRATTSAARVGTHGEYHVRVPAMSAVTLTIRAGVRRGRRAILGTSRN